MASNRRKNGRSCEEHPICGHVLQEDSVVHFRKVQVLIEGKEESAIAAFWVSGWRRQVQSWIPSKMSCHPLEVSGRCSCTDYRDLH